MIIELLDGKSYVFVRQERRKKAEKNRSLIRVTACGSRN
jgi:hypothetical protein